MENKKDSLKVRKIKAMVSLLEKYSGRKVSFQPIEYNVNQLLESKLKNKSELEKRQIKFLTKKLEEVTGKKAKFITK